MAAAWEDARRLARLAEAQLTLADGRPRFDQQVLLQAAAAYAAIAQVYATLAQGER